jgi:hypothetical protein
VANLKSVKSLEPPDDLNEKAPNLFFSELLSLAFLLVYYTKDVTPVCVLHNDAKAARGILKEGLFVADNVGVADARQYSDLVQRIFLLLAAQFVHLDFLHGVCLVVGLASHQVNFGE